MFRRCFYQDPLRKRILFSLHIDPITQHLMQCVLEQNALQLELVFDGERPTGAIRDMRTWYTTRLAEPTQHSQHAGVRHAKHHGHLRHAEVLDLSMAQREFEGACVPAGGFAFAPFVRLAFVCLADKRGTLSLRSGCSHCERLRRVVVAVCVRWCLALGLDIPQRRGQQQCKEGRSRGFHGDTLALL